jgi:phenylalanyl-tRNA synthetase beta chain
MHGLKEDWLRSAEWLDTYRGQGLDEGKKSLTFHLVFRAIDRTLASEEVDACMATLREVLTKELQATFRG